MPSGDEVHRSTIGSMIDLSTWARELREIFEGEKPCDLLLKGVKVIDVLNLEVSEIPLAIHRGRIIAHEELRAKEVFEAGGLFAAPGFVDSHIHIESTLLLPHEFARAALKRGTTAVFCDPHELANVMGAEGIRFFLEATEALPLDFYVMLPSCVPSSPYETPGATLGPDDLQALKEHPRVMGLGEFMDVEACLGAEERAIGKLELFLDLPRDGHAPLLRGKALSHYLCLGPSSDHETVDLEEGHEKLKKGMFLYVREGTAARNLKELLPLIKPATAEQMALCSDDLSPVELSESGHMDRILRKAVSLGLDPLLAIRIASLSPLRHLGIRDRGLLAPGFWADLVLLEDLRSFRVFGVIKDGKWVYRDGSYLVDFPPPSSLPEPSFFIPPLHEIRERMRISPKGSTIRAIVVKRDQLVTEGERVSIDLRTKSLEGKDIGIPKVVVIERHRGTGNMGIGFVKGLGIQRGALATSIAHDSHNLIALGMTDDEILLAIETLRKSKGGMAVVRGREILAHLPLPVGGLMSSLSLDETARKSRELEEAVKSLGDVLPHPFMYVSFLALPVIPELRITDKGLFDVAQRNFISLFD